MNMVNDMKAFLEMTGWSVQDLADVVGVKSQTLFKILSKKDSPSCTDRLIPIFYGPNRLDPDRLKSINKSALKKKRIEAIQQFVAAN